MSYIKMNPLRDFRSRITLSIRNDNMYMLLREIQFASTQFTLNSSGKQFKFTTTISITSVGYKLNIFSSVGEIMQSA